MVTSCGLTKKMNLQVHLITSYISPLGTGLSGHPVRYLGGYGPRDHVVMKYAVNDS